MSGNQKRISFSRSAEMYLATLLVVFTCISIRLAELPLWNDAAFFVDGERLLATHDAYAWLAGAKGIGQWADAPFAALLKYVQSVTGFNVAFIGFWSPLIFIPLLALPICLLAAALRLPEGGVTFGILTTAGLGFLVRTRLGFCDTDIVNLLFPVSALCLLALWLENFFSASRSEAQDVFSPLQSSVVALAIGLAGKAALWLYPGSSSILLPSYCLAAVIAFFFIRSDARRQFINGLVLIFALTFAGWIGALLAVCWLLTYQRYQSQLSLQVYWASIFVLGCTVFFLGNLDSVIGGLIYRLYLYTKVGTPDMINNATGLRLPDIAQSVREAQNLEWSLLGSRLGGNWLVFALGLSGFGFVCWRRPALLVFLPFLGLGLASVKLGNRFAMYGTIGIGMGLGLGLSELLVMLKQSQGRRWIAQLIVACVALWPSAQLMNQVTPVPVLPKVYAQTFLDLRASTEPDALLWQWWDYGYAGQYYAERATMGDGARQSGPWLYPLAKVHCAKSSHEAAQLMRYFGQAMYASGAQSTADTMHALFVGNPVAGLQTMAAPQARDFVSALEQQAALEASIPQYFVLSWENLRLAAWISYYGHWDIVAATSAPGKIQQIQGEVRIDSVTGSLVLNGKTVLLDSLDIVDASEARHFDWANGAGMHVLINQLSRQVFLMDVTMYRSMMVQMLIQPTAQFAGDFTLVNERYPWNRVYKVR